jgi:hypothetical protein
MAGQPVQIALSYHVLFSGICFLLSVSSIVLVTSSGPNEVAPCDYCGLRGSDIVRVFLTPKPPDQYQATRKYQVGLSLLLVLVVQANIDELLITRSVSARRKRRDLGE